jgi:hypothetical protein
MPHKLLQASAQELANLDGHILDVLSIRKPLSEEEALGWAKIVSKLSPILGNLLEFEIVRVLNEGLDLPPGVEWERQDPGFPDAAMTGFGFPMPGIEIKAWFPLATEITGRFRESETRLSNSDIYLAVVCWLPEYLLFGRPQVLGVFVEDALTVARARDRHYYDPPNYLVREPEDTSARTRNLQQTNTNGFRCQETGARLQEAVREVAKWPPHLLDYSPGSEVQNAIRELQSRFSYRLDTNFAKVDRVEHEGLETFKTKMLATKLHGRTIMQWAQDFSRRPEAAAKRVMELAARAPD